MSHLAAAITELQEIYRQRQPGYAQQFDAKLAEIMALDDPEAIVPLISQFDDEAEYGEIMFSIVHAIESFGESLYLRKLQESLPGFWEKSRDWAQIVHLRLLNSPAVCQTYLELFRNADETKRRAVIEIMESIAQEWPELREKAESAIAVLNSQHV